MIKWIYMVLGIGFFLLSSPKDFNTSDLYGIFVAVLIGVGLILFKLDEIHKDIKGKDKPESQVKEVKDGQEN